MTNSSTLKPPSKVYDESAARFIENDFIMMLEGTSEALSMGRHTIMVSRDPLRPGTHYCITILHDGLPVANETPVTEDLGLSLTRAISAIREAVISDCSKYMMQREFANLE